MTGHLHESVAFDEQTSDVDDYGGTETGWTQVYTCRGNFIYQRGGEADQGGALEGSARFKVKIRQSATARTITSDHHRLRDVRRSIAYNIVEVDNVSDRHWIWIVVESGRAA